MLLIDVSKGISCWMILSRCRSIVLLNNAMTAVSIGENVHVKTLWTLIRKEAYHCLLIWSIKPFVYKIYNVCGLKKTESYQTVMVITVKVPNYIH